MTAPATFAVVGTGWRAGFFHRAARSLPGLLRVAGVVTRSGRAEVEGATAFADLDALLAAERPDFVIVSVPREAAPSAIRELVGAGLPTLVETARVPTRSPTDARITPSVSRSPTRAPRVRSSAANERRGRRRKCDRCARPSQGHGPCARSPRRCRHRSVKETGHGRDHRAGERPT